MPNYEYRCKSCSYEFEELQRVSEPQLVTCPSCHTDNLIRLMSGGAGLHFKGSGFYLTDYKKPGSGGTSSSSETEKKSEEKKPETKKVETKTEAKSTESGSTKKD